MTTGPVVALSWQLCDLGQPLPALCLTVLAPGIERTAPSAGSWGRERGRGVGRAVARAGGSPVPGHCCHGQGPARKLSP